MQTCLNCPTITIITNQFTHQWEYRPEMACWSSDQLFAPSYLQFLPPQNMEQSLASVTDRRSASDSAPYLAVATVVVINKQHIHAIITYVIKGSYYLQHFTILSILKCNGKFISILRNNVWGIHICFISLAAVTLKKCIYNCYIVTWVYSYSRWTLLTS